MKNTDMARWQQMFAPDNSQDELSELQNALSRDKGASTKLEDFLYSQWLVMQSMARREMNHELKKEYQSAANSIADLTGMIFKPDNPKATNRHVSL